MCISQLSDGGGTLGHAFAAQGQQQCGPGHGQTHFFNPSFKETFARKCTSSALFIVKLREREGQRVDLGRSLKGHLWMVDGGWWYTFP